MVAQQTSTDQVQRHIVINAPRSRVWRALTTAEEFGVWFGVDFKGQSFTPGQPTRGRSEYKDHMMELVVDRVEPETLFSYRWHPYPFDPSIDYNAEPPTLVVFELSETADGTLLKVVESGFDGITASRRAEAFEKHSGGWEAQLENIQEHVTAAQP